MKNVVRFSLYGVLSVSLLMITSCAAELTALGSLITAFEIPELKREADKPTKIATTIKIELTAEESEKVTVDGKVMITPTITVSSGATVKPASGVATDFSNCKITYTVTNGTKTKTYDIYIGTADQIAAAEVNGEAPATVTLKDIYISDFQLFPPSSGTRISQGSTVFNAEDAESAANEIYIQVSRAAPLITKENVRSKIILSTNAASLPVEGVLTDDFETAIGVPNPDAKYTIYPKSDPEKEKSKLARTYKIIVERISSSLSYKTYLKSFDLYNLKAYDGKISLFTLILNDDKATDGRGGNIIYIRVPPNAPRVAAGDMAVQAFAELPTEVTVYPTNEILKVDFEIEDNDGDPTTMTNTNAAYTVYPRDDPLKENSLEARHYTVIVNRGANGGEADKYKVTVDPTIQHATVTITAPTPTKPGETEATAGTAIEFTVVTEDGYTSTIWTTPDTGAHTKSGNIYTFSMPPQDVVIHVTTTVKPPPEDPEDPDDPDDPDDGWKGVYF
jgi:hypothetical protein